MSLSYYLAMTLPVTVVCGLNRAATSDAGRALLSPSSDSHLVTHCLDQIHIGLVSRTTVSGFGHIDAALIDLAHGCVSCTLREDVLPTLRDMAADPKVGHVILVLPESVEPIGFLESFLFYTAEDGRSAAELCHIEAVMAVLEPAALVTMMANHETLADRGLNIGDTDNRGLGDLLVGQIECADVILAPGANPQEMRLLRLLNPDARLHTAQPLSIPAAFNWSATNARTSPALIDHLVQECDTADAWRMGWRSHRPLHPTRLHDALQDIAGVALRGRGHFQIATRPSSLIEWDSVGRQLRLGSPDTDIPRRGANLCFVGVSDERDRIAAALDAAQLTDEEHMSPATSWAIVQDPFQDIWLNQLDLGDQ
ncbi:MAG: hypothetical protein CMH41_08680 [Micrococcales bacterium]|nr:hypothetical protein [Micrococcales bacterium]